MNYHDNTAYSSRRLTLSRCQNVDGYMMTINLYMTSRRKNYCFLATVFLAIGSEKAQGASSVIVVKVTKKTRKDNPGRLSRKTGHWRGKVLLQNVLPDLISFKSSVHKGQLEAHLIIGPSDSFINRIDIGACTN